jgi:uncharacterized membrane protein/cytochrome c551/c552
MSRRWAFILLLAAPHAWAEAPADVGASLLRSKGCVACHSDDGRRLVGPSFKGLAGSTRSVVRDGAPLELVADAEYLRRAISSPNAEITEGYPPGLMPPIPLEPAELDAVVAALVAQGVVESGAAEAPPERPLWPLVVASLLFVFGHFLLSSGWLRPRLIARLDLGGFQGAYSLFAAATLGWMIYAWTQAPFVPLWDPVPWTRWVPFLSMPPILVLMVAGYTTRNPATVAQEKAVTQPPVGIVTVTRHPGLISTALWAAVHLPANGDVATATFFGSFVVLSLGGVWHIERRRLRAHGEAWRAFTAQTSILPFAAILGGRCRLDLRGIGAVRLLAGMGSFVVFLFVHGWLTGASPLP